MSDISLQMPIREKTRWKKGAKREKKSVWEIAEYYTDEFKEDIKKLNIKEPSSWTKATTISLKRAD